jgi:hypothetical protein
LMHQMNIAFHLIPLMHLLFLLTNQAICLGTQGACF